MGCCGVIIFVKLYWVVVIKADQYHVGSGLAQHRSFLILVSWLMPSRSSIFLLFLKLVPWLMPSCNSVFPPFLQLVPLLLPHVVLYFTFFRLKESGAINKSLFTLGEVVDAINQNLVCTCECTCLLICTSCHFVMCTWMLGNWTDTDSHHVCFEYAHCQWTCLFSCLR